MRGTEVLPIQLQASVNGTYDSSLLGFGVDENGNFRSNASVGINANMSVSGRHLWRRSFVGIDYSGEYSHFLKSSFYDGTNHQLALAMGTQLGNRWQLTSQVAGGTSNRYVGNSPVFQSSEFEFLNAPTGELFDSRTFYLGNTTSATYSMNRRESFRFSGTGMTVRRRARGLVDMQSYGASGDWVRRVSRRASIGVSYAFSHYDYSKVFGESDIHTLGVFMSRTVGRDWTLSGSLTGARQQTVGVRTVALDPVLVAILGRASGAEVFETDNLIYGYQGGIGRKIRRSTITFNVSRGINPGNGYFLTSISNTVSAGVNHNINRDTSVSIISGYSKMTSLGFTSGRYSGYNTSVALSRKLVDTVGITMMFDWRKFDLEQTTLKRNGYRVSIGLSYHPQRGLANLF